jgi:hypothetical protein
MEIKCPGCKEHISSSSSFCSHCGRAISKQPDSSIQARVACPDGICTGAIKEDGKCGYCGKNQHWVDPDKNEPKELHSTKHKTIQEWSISAKIIVGLLIVITISYLYIYTYLENYGKPYTSLPPSNSTPVEVVANSSWDGSVYQVERYLRNNLKDPDSFEAIQWSPVIKIPAVAQLPYSYAVRCKYRAKNSFGGYVVEEKLFSLDSKGNVVAVSGT